MFKIKNAASYSIPLGNGTVKGTTLKIPWFLWKEIFQFLTLKQLTEFRRVNKEWYNAISPLFSSYLEYKGGGEFFPDVKTDKRSLEYVKCVSFLRLLDFNDTIGNFISRNCRSIQHLTLEESIVKESPFPDNFFHFYVNLSFLQNLNINLALPFETLQFFASHAKRLRSLTFSAKALKTDEAAFLLKMFQSDSLDSLGLEDITSSLKITDIINESFPQLKIFRSKLVSFDVDDISIDQLIPKVNVSTARVNTNNLSGNHTIELNFKKLPKLHSLILLTKNRQLKIASHNAEPSWPQITFLSLFCYHFSFFRSLSSYFPNLTTFSLCCKKLGPHEFCLLLSKLTSVENLLLYVYDSPEIIFSQRIQKFNIKRLSLNFKCGVTSEVFIWASYCLPRLHELSIMAAEPLSIETAFFEFKVPLYSLFRFVSTSALSLKFWRILNILAPQLTYIHLQTDYPHLKLEVEKEFPNFVCSKSENVFSSVIAPLGSLP